MPSPIALRWVSDSARTRFGDDMDQRLQAWAAEWGLSLPGKGVARQAVASELTAAADGAWHALVPAVGPWMRWTGALPAEVATRQWGPDAGSSPIAKDAAMKALRAMEASLRGFLDSEATSKDDPLTQLPTAVAGAHWGLHYGLQWGQGRIEVLVTSAWLDRQGWLRRPAPKALRPFTAEAVLATLPVTLSVELGRVDVAIGDLAHLSEGDVILMAQPAADALVVRALEADLTLRAHLGSRAPHRAIQFISTPSAKGTNA